MRRLLLLVLIGCSAKTNTATEPAAESVTCGTGTHLADGACEVDASGCASGTVVNDAGGCDTLDTVCTGDTALDAQTKKCAATLRCGATTKNVDGVCTPFVRLALATYGATGVTGFTGSRDWYGVPFDSAVRTLVGGVPPASGAVFDDVVKLGSSEAPYASSALMEVPLQIGGSYLIFAVPAGTELTTSVLEGASAQAGSTSVVIRPPLGVDLALAAGLPFPFSPVAGDQIVVVLGDGRFVQLPFPSLPATATAASVTLALLNSVSGLFRSALVGADHHHSLNSFEPVIISTGRSHDHLFAAGDTITLEAATLGLVATFTGTLPPAKRYACLSVEDAEHTMCFDGEAHGATTERQFDGLTQARAPTLVSARVATASAFGDAAGVFEVGPSGDAVIVATPSISSFLPDTTYNLQAVTGVTAAPSFASSQSLSFGAGDGFLAIIAADSKPTLVAVQPRAATTHTTFSVVNGSGASIDLYVGDTNPSTGTPLAAGAQRDTNITTLCPNNFVIVDAQCYSVATCDDSIDGKHALVVTRPSGAPLLVKASGDSEDLVSGCP